MVHANMTSSSAPTSCEKVEVLITEDSEDLSKLVADRIAKRINEKAQAGEASFIHIMPASKPGYCAQIP